MELKTASALAVTFAVLAGAAAAQAPAPVPQAAAATPATTAPVKASTTVSGVTVSPGPRKTCKPRDKDCIAMVMAEVKELYPEQLKQFCYQQKMNVLKQDMQANMAGWCDGPGLGATELCHHYVQPVVKQVCAPDPPVAKK